MQEVTKHKTALEKEIEKLEDATADLKALDREAKMVEDGIASTGDKQKLRHKVALIRFPDVAKGQIVQLLGAEFKVKHVDKRRLELVLRSTDARGF